VLYLNSNSKRPLYLYILRDGVEITGFRYTYKKFRQSIVLSFTDENAPAGIHAYSVVVSGKLVSSPVIFDVK
jgi:hypothetical protein